MAKKKPRWVYQDLYHANIEFYIDWTLEEYQEYCRKRFGFEWVNHEGIQGHAAVVDQKSTGKTVYLMWARPQKKGLKRDSVIVHESVHLANKILKDRGYKFDPEDDEPLAYLVDWIYEKAQG